MKGLTKQAKMLLVVLMVGLKLMALSPSAQSQAVHFVSVMPDIGVDVNAPDYSIDLGNYFIPEYHNYFFAFSSDESIVQPVVNGNNLTLSFTPGQTGIATVTVVSDNGNGQPVGDEFHVAVGQGDGVHRISEIPDISVGLNSPNQIVELANFFTSTNPLTFNAVSSDPSIVQTVVNGNELSLSFMQNQFGVVELNVTATDTSGASNTDAFQVTVYENEIGDIGLSNPYPYVSNPIPDKFVNEDSSVYTINLHNHFDVSFGGWANGLNFGVNYDNEDVVSISRSGSTIYIQPKPNRNGSVNVWAYGYYNGYTASDHFVFTVNPVNDYPVASDVSYSVLEDEVLQVSPPGILSNATDLENDVLTAALVSQPANGTVVLQTDGSFDYTPNTNFNGTDTFTYVANDGAGDSNTASVSISVTPVDDTPVTSDFSFTMIEDNNALSNLPAENPYIVPFQNNITEVDNDPLTFTFETQPANGTLSLQPDGTYGYTPNLNYFGSDTFTYKVNDRTSDSNTATVSITIEARNDGPITPDLMYTIRQDETLQVDTPGFMLEMTDVDSDVFTGFLQRSGVPQDENGGFKTPNGSIIEYATQGSFVYQPDPGFTGDDFILYRVFDGLRIGKAWVGNDGLGVMNSNGIMTVRVEANSVPVVSDQAYSTDEDTPLSIASPGILSNATDAHGDDLSVSVVSGPTNGTLNLNADGSFTYTPNENFNGTDSFTYLANDGHNDSNIATTTITVNPVNDTPVLINAITDKNVLENSAAIEIDLQTIFEDVDGEELTYSITNSNESLLTVAIVDQMLTLSLVTDQYGIADISLTANDPSGESVSDAFRVTVTEPNLFSPETNIHQGERFKKTESYDLDGDGDLDVIALNNFSQIRWFENDGQGNFTLHSIIDIDFEIKFIKVSDIDSDGDMDIYYGGYGYLYWLENNGQQSFANHEILDPTTTNNGIFLDAIVVDFNQDGVVDILTSMSGDLYLYENDGDQNFTRKVFHDGLLVRQLMIRDLDGDGDMDVAAANENWSYWSGGAVWFENDGSGGFTYRRAFEADYTSLIDPVDLDKDGDVDILAFSKAPSQPSTFAWYENDGNMNFTERIISTNLNPEIYLKAVDVNNNGTLDIIACSFENPSITWYENDGSQNFSQKFVTASRGTLSASTADFNGDGAIDIIASFLYDGIRFVWYENLIDNHRPVLVDNLSEINVNEDAPDTVINLSDYIVDHDGDPVTFSVTNDNESLLTASISGSNLTLSYLQGQFGVTNLEVTATDSIGAWLTHTIRVTVNFVEYIPVASDASYSILEDNVLSVAAPGVLDHATDNNGDALSAVLVSGSVNGTVELQNDGSFSYTPNADFYGEDSFVYLANDGKADSNEATVTITVDPVNDAPVASDLSYTTTEDHNLQIAAPGVLANASDIDGDELNFIVVSNPSNGTLALLADGSFTYTPNENFSGTDIFEFAVNDGTEDSNPATVAITVDPVNDTPSFNLGLFPEMVESIAGPQIINNSVVDILPGSSLEQDQQVSFIVNTDKPGFFDVLPQIDVNGTLTFTPNTDADGVVTLEVIIQDNGGTENGGVDTSAPQTIQFTIEKVEEFKLVLLDSQGNGLAGASAQYQMDGAWLDVPGTTDANGEMILDLVLSGRIKFRMTYEGSNQTINQDLDVNSTVTFQTVSTTVELINSSGAYISDENGRVEFNRSGWQSFGTTQSGSASREMLPGNYNFRMTYANRSFTISQNIANNPVVTFETVPVTVSLVDSSDSPISNDSEVTFRGKEWMPMGSLSSGSVTKELLPASYRFRVTHNQATVEKRSNVKFENDITFKTKNVSIELRNSAGDLITDGTARIEYNSNGWNDLGITDTGSLSVELLPKTYRFRIEHMSTKKDKTQNVQFNSTIAFQTVNFTTELRNSESSLIVDENGTVQFYAGGWNALGDTLNGAASVELLPNLYNFRMTYANASVDQKNDFFQDTVVFQTERITVELRNSMDELFIDADGNVQFNSGGWQEFGSLVDGVATKELLPKVYNFRMNYANATNDKKNDGDDPLLVTFNTNNVLVQLIDSAGYLLEDDFNVEYNSGGWQPLGSSNTGQVSLELLPKTYNFRLEYNGKKETQKVDVIDPETIVDFFTGQVFSLSNSAVKVNSGGWKDFSQNMEMLSGNYKFKYADGHNTTYAIEAGFINEIE